MAAKDSRSRSLSGKGEYLKTGQKPLVFGHRGSPEKAVENTIPSFLIALEEGADGIELDVRLTADHEVVVFHDPNLLRLAGRNDEISKLTLKELRKVELYVQGPEPGRIPTLEEVLDALPSSALMNIELKEFPRDPDGLERAVVDILRRRRMLERTLISSFNAGRLRKIWLLEPALKRAYIHYGSIMDWPLSSAIRHAGKLDGVHPHFSLVDRGYLEKSRRLGWFVNAWTVNEGKEMRRLVELGINGIFTDRPAVLRKIITTYTASD